MIITTQETPEHMVRHLRNWNHTVSYMHWWDEYQCDQCPKRWRFR